jgi:hypothetical protein
MRNGGFQSVYSAAKPAHATTKIISKAAGCASLRIGITRSVKNLIAHRSGCAFREPSSGEITPNFMVAASVDRGQADIGGASPQSPVLGKRSPRESAPRYAIEIWRALRCSSGEARGFGSEWQSCEPRGERFDVRGRHTVRETVQDAGLAANRFAHLGVAPDHAEQLRRDVEK